MNKNHRSIWNAKTNSWVAVSEKTSAQGKKSKAVQSCHTSLGKLIGTTVVLASGFLSQFAFATTPDCRSGGNGPIVNPTTGNDSLICFEGDFSSWNSLGGDDYFQFSNRNGDVIFSGNISGGSGKDSFDFFVNPHNPALPNTNTYSIQSSTSINTFAGDDLVRFATLGDVSATLAGTVNLGDGNDRFYTGGKLTINTSINGGTGEDEFTIGYSGLPAVYQSEDYDNTVFNGAISGGDGNDIFNFMRSVTANGTISGGNGDDSFELDRGSAKQINGDAGADTFHIRQQFIVSNTDFAINGGSEEDSLTIHKINSSINAEKLLNLENISITENSNITFTGNKLTLGNSLISASSNQLVIDEGSQVGFSSNNFTVAAGKGIFNNGTLNLRGTTAGKKLTIDGNYEGGNNSSILLNAKLGNDSSPIDKLIVKGSTSGKSKIFINNVDGTGAATTNGINVVQVLGNSNATFTLGSAVQVGNFEYFLFKSGKNWFLESIDSTNPDDCVGCEPTPTPTPTPTPSPSPTPTPTPTPSPSPQIYRPAVSGYVLAAPAQFDQTASLIGTYEQRQANPVINSDIWGRAHTLQTRLNTTTFGYDHNSQNIQFGKIINSKAVGQEFNSQTGLTAVIGQQSADYFDEKRQFTPTGKFTGESSTNSYSLGAYYTQSQQDKPYLDLQAYVSSHNTQFNDVNGGKAKQNGLGLAISAEIGKSYALSTSGLEITPQAQFIFQTATYDGFTDSVSSVSKQTAESLRVRAGVTLQSGKAKDSGSKTNWNVSLNLWQEVIDTPNRVISGYVVSPEKNQKPWVELGIGVNQQLSEASSLSAQISHQNSLSGNQRKANSINLSYRFKW